MSGTLKKNTSLRISWSQEHENMLLDLWEEKIEELRGTWADVRTKIDNLTRKYKQEKNKIGPTGGSPSGWVFYNKVHNILGSFELHNIEISMHESTDMSTLVQNVIEFDPNDSCSSFCNDFTDEECQLPKRRKTNANVELVQLAKERIEMQRQQQQERKEQLGEVLKTLDTISSQNAIFQSEILNILREKK